MTPLKDVLDDDGILEEGNLDAWLESVNENEFDQKMDTYLSSEKLVHFQERSDTASSLSGNENPVTSSSLNYRIYCRQCMKYLSFLWDVHTILST